MVFWNSNCLLEWFCKTKSFVESQQTFVPFKLFEQTGYPQVNLVHWINLTKILCLLSLAIWIYLFGANVANAFITTAKIQSHHICGLNRNDQSYVAIYDILRKSIFIITITRAYPLDKRYQQLKRTINYIVWFYMQLNNIKASLYEMSNATLCIHID